MEGGGEMGGNENRKEAEGDGTDPAAAAGTVARRRWKGEEKWGGMRTEMEGG